MMKPSEGLRVAGRPIAYYPKLAKPLGGVNAAILFGHFFYWNDKTQYELGIYRTAEEIEIETGLSVQEQRTARAKLRERGVLIETEKRIEHRIYYKLNLDAFDDLMLQHSGSEESTAPKCNINSPELQNQHSGSEESTAVIRTEDLTEDLAVYTPLPPNAENGKGGLNADAFVSADAETCERGSDEPTSLKTKSDSNGNGSLSGKPKNANVPRRRKSDGVPLQEIADLYNEVLGGRLPSVQVLNDTRKRAIVNRWCEMLGTAAPNGKVRFGDKETGLAWFAGFFRKVAMNPFWMGENQTGFAVNFDWIFKAGNFVKILEWHPPKTN
ncbi:hypothetical protein KEM39_09505 [Neisseria sp. Marseille-Q1983]|uniref:hypothetical protein n=1 Tax=Neisseria sp. Marseille-Q1983 TaxID=2830768 RepID=UPI001BAA0A88|nr:hypothetical protein [Neisseria sp. Marseille-Q1983]